MLTRLVKVHQRDKSQTIRWLIRVAHSVCGDVGIDASEMRQRCVADSSAVRLADAPMTHGTEHATCAQSVTSEKKGSNKNKPERPQAPLDFCERVVGYLNRVAGTAHRHTTRSTRELLASRLAEGFDEPDFLRAIDNQWATWEGTEYQKYMRPSTLFSPKFDGYQGTNPEAAKNRGAGPASRPQRPSDLIEAARREAEKNDNAGFMVGVDNADDDPNEPVNEEELAF